VGLSVQSAVALLEQGRARGVLTVAGIVTDDDPAVDQTLVADDARGILVPGAPWPTRPAVRLSPASPRPLPGVCPASSRPFPGLRPA
jgi:hypothetical protein